ncbi:MAG: hypothetical protein LBD67_01905 [Candidatus Accumulibacter sp.]|nr:hypothetical protein [Accumulibacter sp.]
MALFPFTTVRGDFAGTHRRHLFPFVLSLSKYERTLRGLPNASLIRVVQGKDIPGLSSPYPSTSSGRTDWKGVLRQASFDRLRTEQGK